MEGGSSGLRAPVLVPVLTCQGAAVPVRATEVGTRTDCVSLMIGFNFFESSLQKHSSLAMMSEWFILCRAEIVAKHQQVLKKLKRKALTV